MKLIHVLRSVYCEPWLIRPDVHAQVSEIVKAHVSGKAHADKIMEGMEDGSECMPEMMPNGVMVIPIDGVIGNRVSQLEKSSGVVDCSDLCALLEGAMEDENVKGVVLDFNSPGGTVTGTPEVGAKVAQLSAQKRCIAFTDAMCCSAAYWIASQSSAIYCTSSATMGSVGVYMPFLDQSRAAEMQGLKQEVFKAGKYKGMGVPGTSLTAEQRDMIQSRVTMLHDQFKAAVRSGRGIPMDDEDMEGQDFYGCQWVDNGMADNVASREDAIRDAGMK